MATQLPKVGIVLLNWNGAEDTLECLRSLRGSSYPNYFIVIVDNGSAGDDVQILRREAADCHIIANGRNDGFSEGNNIGMRYALAHDADYVLILNNDAVVAPGLLDVLVDVAERDESVGVLAPRIRLYDDPGKVAYPRKVDTWPLFLYFHLGTLGIFNRGIMEKGSEPIPVRSVDGCCLLVRREVLTRVGLFDPLYFVGGYESLCLCRRTLSHGFRILAAPDAAIRARVSRSLGGRRKAALTYAYWNPRNRVIFARRYLSWPHYLLFLLGLPVHVFVWTFGWGRKARMVEKVPALLRGLRDGFKTDLAGTPEQIRALTLEAESAGQAAR